MIEIAFHSQPGGGPLLIEEPLKCVAAKQQDSEDKTIGIRVGDMLPIMVFKNLLPFMLSSFAFEPGEITGRLRKPGHRGIHHDLREYNFHSCRLDRPFLPRS